MPEVQMWSQPPPSTYRAPCVAVYLARRVVAAHVDLTPVPLPCPHCWEPDGTERVACPLLRDALRVLLDYGRAPGEWHPADAL